LRCWKREGTSANGKTKQKIVSPALVKGGNYNMVKRRTRVHENFCRRAHITGNQNARRIAGSPAAPRARTTSIQGLMYLGGRGGTEETTW